MIRIGVAQICNSTSLEQNVHNIRQCLKVFESTPVDLVLFPECALSGFSSQIGKCNPDVLGKYLNEFRQWSSAHHKMLIIPSAVADGKIYNSGYVFFEDYMEQFYKVGLTDSEKKFFSVPEDYKKQIFELKGYKFSLLICLEAQLDASAYFSQGELDFVLWPGYWGWEKSDEWSAHKSDGSDNQVYLNVDYWSVPLIQANFSHNDDDDDFRKTGPHGLSVVVDQENKLVYRASYEEQECFVVELDSQKP